MKVSESLSRAGALARCAAVCECESVCCPLWRPWRPNCARTTKWWWWAAAWPAWLRRACCTTTTPLPRPPPPPPSCFLRRPRASAAGSSTSPALRRGPLRWVTTTSILTILPFSSLLSSFLFFPGRPLCLSALGLGPLLGGTVGGCLCDQANSRPFNVEVFDFMTFVLHFSGMSAQCELLTQLGTSPNDFFSRCGIFGGTVVQMLLDS